MLHAQLLTFDRYLLSFSEVCLSTSTVLCGHILFCYTADHTMQRDDFATKICKIATKFSYVVAKLRVDFFVNFYALCNFHNSAESHLQALSTKLKGLIRSWDPGSSTHLR